ncbi:thioredoxin family protein [Solitalea canadensis]|uniref:Protein containing a thioredoxin domain n=1 Tax=Solitalea canadensis (strain ATCC 29591 / DSM 3403 / JCM 21819 / LMG 8368 / NBRC 15130 / NCIMB 12057 / USAM 9D) TaxID=929556 RepID=H8KQG7_SOLCM|nr:thioredoxin family protein [Solitalea canadensis]AFD06583.1 protein containing a thioredoxin domain [Solitalea canadensis DSM 3403]
MQKSIITVFLIGFSFIKAYAQNENKGIKFFQGTVKETFAKAKQENKLIFVDCYTSWCGPCKWMEKYVFTNDTAASYYNKTFVNYKLDMEKGEGIDFRKQYGVNSFPTYLFLDANGKLVHKAAGRMPTTEFVSIAQKTSDPKETSSSLESRYNNGDKSAGFLFKYITSLKNSNREKALLVYKELVAQTADKNLLTDEGWELIKLYPLDEESRLYKFLMANKTHFVSKYGSDEVDKIQKTAVERALNAAIYKNDKDSFFKRLDTYRQDKNADESTAAEMELMYYLYSKDYPSFIKQASQYSQTVLKKNDAKLSFVARYCLNSTEETEALQQACAMAHQATELNGKEFSNYSTYAELCYKLNNKNEALRAAQISLQVLGDENPKAKKRVELLIEKIQAM